jgi:hypothetical protein
MEDTPGSLMVKLWSILSQVEGACDEAIAYPRG